MEDFKLLRSQTGEYYGDFNDLEFSNDTNDLKLVSGSARTRQNIIKILLTVSGENIKYLNYGSELQNIGTLKFAPGQQQAIIRESIIRALTYLNIIEESDDPEEIMEEISSIKFRPNELDPRRFDININVVLQSGDILQISLEE